jgi:predicted dinucleotide-binding enzyme
MKIGVLGSGDVGRVLADGFLKHGHPAMLGTRERDKLAEWGTQHAGAQVGTFSEAAAFGEVLVLAVKGSAAAEALRLAGNWNLKGKVVIDATNPIADGPPVNGVLKFFTSLDESLMERLQRKFPAARFVKAFNSVGNARMVDPQFEGGRPTMFICGNDESARATVAGLVAELGWDAADMGKAEAARAIEPL